MNTVNQPSLVGIHIYVLLTTHSWHALLKKNEICTILCPGTEENQGVTVTVL